MALVIPEGYVNILGSVENTEKAIKSVKDMFQDNLSAQLALLRVTAPMVVLSGTGLNDDLSGVERPVAFDINQVILIFKILFILLVNSLKFKTIPGITNRNHKTNDFLHVHIPDAYVEHGSLDLLKKEIGLDADSITKQILEKFIIG